MLQLVGHPVPAVVAAAGQAVVRQASGPHDLRPGVVVLRILRQDLRVLLHRAQQALRQRVGDLHVPAVGEVPLHGVHHDVRAAAGRLVVRQGHGQFRVHDRELRPAVVAAVAALHQALFLRDHGAVAHFAARRRDGQDDAQGQAGRGLALVIIEIPHVAVVGHAVADGLRAVDGAAAAHGQQEVYAFLFAQFNAFVHQAQVRVRHRTAQGHKGNARRFQRIRDPLQQAGADHAAAAVMDQDLSAAEFLHQVGDPGFRALSENHFRGGIVIESEHRFSLRSFFCSAFMIIFD